MGSPPNNSKELEALSVAWGPKTIEFRPMKFYSALPVHATFYIKGLIKLQTALKNTPPVASKSIYFVEVKMVTSF